MQRTKQQLSERAKGTQSVSGLWIHSCGCVDIGRAHLSELLHLPVGQILKPHSIRGHLGFDPPHISGIPEQ